MEQTFYERDTVTVARELLGKVIVYRGAAGRIVEVEAYLGEGDLAAHSARGLTARTQVIFGPAGRAYVYLIYGMYECLNFVVEADGKAIYTISMVQSELFAYSIEAVESWLVKVFQVMRHFSLVVVAVGSETELEIDGKTNSELAIYALSSFLNSYWVLAEDIIIPPKFEKFEFDKRDNDVVLLRRTAVVEDLFFSFNRPLA